MRSYFKNGDAVKVMDPWRGIVECFRGRVTEDEDPMTMWVVVRPSTPPRGLVQVDSSVVQPVDDNRLMRPMRLMRWGSAAQSCGAP